MICYSTEMCKIPTDPQRDSLFVQYRGYVEDTTEKVRHSLEIRIQCKLAVDEAHHICKNGLWDGKSNDEIMCRRKNETPPAGMSDIKIFYFLFWNHHQISKVSLLCKSFLMIPLPCCDCQHFYCFIVSSFNQV